MRMPGTPKAHATALRSQSLTAAKAQPASSQGVTICEAAEPMLMAT